MLRFILRRILQAIPVLIIIATLTFFMVRLAPGKPFDAEKATTPEIRARLEAHYGLDKPLLQQYFSYMGNLVKGDFGPSFKYANRSVNELIAASFPVSLELGAYAMCIALMLGLLAGVIASLQPNSPTDYVPMSMACRFLSWVRC